MLRCSVEDIYFLELIMIMIIKVMVKSDYVLSKRSGCLTVLENRKNVKTLKNFTSHPPKK